jgi:Alpha/beta hydrolase family
MRCMKCVISSRTPYVRRHPSTRLLSALCAVLLVLSSAQDAAANVTGVVETGTCVQATVPVSVPALPGTYHLVGQLCLPSGPPPTTVQVLIPGATYDHAYWDFPAAGYSYQRYAQSAGQATFALDRLNTGGSSRVPSALVTIQVDASTLHQVIEALTSGRVDGMAFATVVTVGHSLGSIIAVDEAARWHDEAAVVLTGFTHWLNPRFITALSTGQVLEPAQLDPRLIAQPTGDLTTTPGARARWFYAPGSSPRVIAEDEATKTVITAGELATFPVPMALPESEQITVPVLQAVGASDAVFWCGLLTPCATAAQLRKAEAPFFANAPSYTAYVLPRSGHDLNLAVSHDQLFAVLTAWVRTHAS